MSNTCDYEASGDKKVFKDSSSECAICLNNLNEGETIELGCGHRWHLECLKEQLRHAQPETGRRILFSGCRCAKCNEFCDHSALHHLTRRTDSLRTQVDALIREQMQNDPDINSMDEGRQKYAFYLCSSCREPYFGGTIECADMAEGELPSTDPKLCPTCSPETQTHCRHPLEHRGWHVWKCRYCCKPSTYLCYGTVHFCHDCHKRNSDRVAQQHRGAQPPALEGIPCCEQDCPYPKPSSGQTKHSNGPSPSCEQLYYCAACISSPDSNPAAAFAVPPGSHNLCINPSGQQGLVGWKQFGRMSWKVEEQTTLPVNATTTTNFVSSFRPCVMGQAVELHRHIRRQQPPATITTSIEFSAMFKGRSDCPSIFQLKACAFNAGRRIVQQSQSRVFTAPADCWERASLILQVTPEVRTVMIVVIGQDQRFWQGNYGSKVAECSIRILGTPEELEQILLPTNRQRVLGENQF